MVRGRSSARGEDGEDATQRRPGAGRAPRYNREIEIPLDLLAVVAPRIRSRLTRMRPDSPVKIHRRCRHTSSQPSIFPLELAADPETLAPR